MHLADTNEAVLIEVNENKDNLEIIDWHYLREASLKQKERQAIEEGSRILTLESAAGDALNSLSSSSKSTQNNSLVQENDEKFYLKRDEKHAKAIESRDVEKLSELVKAAAKLIEGTAVGERECQQTFLFTKIVVSLQAFS